MPVQPVIDEDTGRNIFDRLARGHRDDALLSQEQRDRINFHEFLYFFMEDEVSAGSLEGLGLSRMQLDEMVAKGRGNKGGRGRREKEE